MKPTLKDSVNGLLMPMNALLFGILSDSAPGVRAGSSIHL